ncbi:MAG: hypothetical protein HFI57_03360 [Lachnospiraceae bacterium]|nr:hypothetical protein [Lachnospiraceae bacterium]
MRRDKSKWSEKNKALAGSLEERGRIMMRRQTPDARNGLRGWWTGSIGI